jgi:hypothetical protein
VFRSENSERVNGKALSHKGFAADDGLQTFATFEAICRPCVCICHIKGEDGGAGARKGADLWASRRARVSGVAATRGGERGVPSGVSLRSNRAAMQVSRRAARAWWW